MKSKKIFIILLIFSMLFINVTSVWAKELETDNLVTINIHGENLSENNISTNSIGDINPSQITAQSKGYNGNYDNGDEDIYQKDKFASYYFLNLQNNFGYNTHGSCGYVAVAMLLSYYDTY